MSTRSNTGKCCGSLEGTTIKLYSKAAPVGAVTTIVPVGTAHVGCTVTVAVGAAGGVGTALTVTVVGC